MTGFKIKNWELLFHFKPIYDTMGARENKCVRKQKIENGG